MSFSFQAHSKNSLSSHSRGGVCKICFEVYTSEKRMPLVIPCGHTICAECLKSLRNQCPHCRTSFQKSQAKRNYALLELLAEFVEKNENCSTHKREIDRFCKACMKLMCSVCHCQHIGSATIISDVNLKDDVKKFVMEVKSQEKAFGQRIYIDYQIEKRQIERTEDWLKQNAKKALEDETRLLISEEAQLIQQAEETVNQEKEKQEAIEKVKKSTQARIEAVQARHKTELEDISSKIKNLMSSIEAKNQENQQLLTRLK